jgi:hypothetical protein
MKMKKGSITTLVLSFVFVLMFCDSAIGGGWEPCPGCCPDTLPAPNRGPYLYGTFTAARDKSASSVFPEYAVYDVHVILRHKLNQVHLFSFPVPAPLSEPPAPADYILCGYETSDIKGLLAKIPCIWGFSEPFGLPGVPVISDLYITKIDFCGTPDEMIHGLITIRVVP